jgi:hypothetical protein
MARPPERLTVEELAAGLQARTAPEEAGAGRCRIVALDGWSGSGKTSLADRLSPALGAPCVHVDDWVPGWDGLARSVELLVEWVLTPLAAGQPARWQRWDWDTGRFGEWTVLPPRGLVLVEGCGAGSALARPWVSTLVWLCLDEQDRDRRLRARPDWPTYAPWADMWAAQERALRAGEDPLAAADVVVDTGGEPPGSLLVTWTG